VTPCTRHRHKKGKRYPRLCFHINPQAQYTITAPFCCWKTCSYCKVAAVICILSFQSNHLPESREPRHNLQNEGFVRGLGGAKQRERSVESLPTTPRVMFPISECSTFFYDNSASSSVW
jgi:hypothetical protein